MRFFPKKKSLFCIPVAAWLFWSYLCHSWWSKRCLSFRGPSCQAYFVEVCHSELMWWTLFWTSLRETSFCHYGVRWWLYKELPADQAGMVARCLYFLAHDRWWTNIVSVSNQVRPELSTACAAIRPCTAQREMTIAYSKWRDHTHRVGCGWPRWSWTPIHMLNLIPYLVVIWRHRTKRTRYRFPFASVP